jgi:hypothetical protein
LWSMPFLPFKNKLRLPTMCPSVIFLATRLGN